MGWLDRIFGRPSVPAPAPGLARPRPADLRVMGRALAGGRVSVDEPNDFFAAPGLVTEADSPEDVWRGLSLDSQALLKTNWADLVDLLLGISPEISRATWDLLRLCNPGWTAIVKRPGSERTYKAGQAVADAFIDHLEDLYGSADTVVNQLFLGFFVRGATCAELVVDPKGQFPVDLVTPDPASIRFRSGTDPVRGRVWIPGQYQGADWVSLDSPLFRYLAVDKMPGKPPYGRPLVQPAVFIGAFLISLLHDLKRVIQQQGYPRLDGVIDLAALVAAYPDVANDPDALEDLVAGIVAKVQTEYASLRPEDMYLHTSAVQIGGPIGAVDASSLGAVEGLISAFERMSIRGLKTMPLLMGITDGVSEANANRQWEIHAAGIKSLQHLAESLLERLFGMALRVQGIQADVEFRFAELRAAEELRDQQTLQLKIANYAELVAEGYASRDEAAEDMLGHPPVLSEDELQAEKQAAFAAFQSAAQNGPDTTGQSGQPGDGQEPTPAGNADPGAQRSARWTPETVLDAVDRLAVLTQLLEQVGEDDAEAGHEGP